MTRKINTRSDVRIDRRAMLRKLGLAAGAAYMAPAMLQLSQARASGGSGASSGSGGASNSFSGASGGSRSGSGHNWNGSGASSASRGSRPRSRSGGQTQIETRRFFRRFFGSRS